MASDDLLDVIAGLVKRDGETKKEEKKLAREKVKAEKLKAEAEEEDEDEDPVGDPEETPAEASEAETEPEAEPEPEEEPPPPEEEPEDDVDPVLVNKVVGIVTDQLKKIMQDVQDKSDAEKFRKGESQLSGKKEKINTSPTMEQPEVRKGKIMNFKEAIRMSVTGTSLAEGYEEVVLGILEDARIDGPLGYEPFFEKGKLYVEKGSEKQAAKVLKQSRDINKVPKIIGETTEFTEYADLEDLKQKYEILATTEAVDVDGRRRGFREALKRLTYEKIQQLKKEGAAEFMAAASAAKREGKKKFKFGGKEYPVTIKVDIPLKGEKKEEVTIGDVLDQIVEESEEIDESNELQAIMALDDAGISAEINRKGQVVIKKKDKKKAQQALEKSFKKGGWPTLKLEDVEEVEADGLVDLNTYLEMKMSVAAKKKRALWAKSSAGKKSLKKSAKRALKVKSGSIKIDKARGRAMAKARKKGGIRNEFEIDEASSKKARNTAADQIEAIADKGGAEAPALFSLASKLRKGTHSTTGLKLSKQVTSILKANGIKEHVQKPRTAYEIVSEARTRVIANKPKWEPENSEPRLS